MTSPTDQLKAEHEKILTFLDVAEKICAGLEAKRDVSPVHLGRVIEFIEVFIDEIHHRKEEDLLFPAMREAGIRGVPGPISEMMIDHIQGRSLARGMKPAALRYGKHGRKAPKQFAERAKRFMSLLREHIRKEDEIYFQLAERALSERQKKELSESFEKLERTGARKEERASKLQILKDLERAFPD